eukprot:6822440-Prymnesium_polylepis.1
MASFYYPWSAPDDRSGRGRAGCLCVCVLVTCVAARPAGLGVRACVACALRLRAVSIAGLLVCGTASHASPCQCCLPCDTCIK